MTNPSIINLILNHDERILTYPTYLKTCKEDPNLSPIEMAATYRLPSKKIMQIENLSALKTVKKLPNYQLVGEE